MANYTSASAMRAQNLLKKDQKIAKEFEEACPPERQAHLAALVKRMKGDKDKIASELQKWWDEPDV
jgi:hypothetical protein